MSPTASLPQKSPRYKTTPRYHLSSPNHGTIFPSRYYTSLICNFSPPYTVLHLSGVISPFSLPGIIPLHSLMHWYCLSSHSALGLMTNPSDFISLPLKVSSPFFPFRCHLLSLLCRCHLSLLLSSCHLSSSVYGRERCAEADSSLYCQPQCFLKREDMFPLICYKVQELSEPYLRDAACFCTSYAASETIILCCQLGNTPPLSCVAGAIATKTEPPEPLLHTTDKIRKNEALYCAY